MAIRTAVFIVCVIACAACTRTRLDDPDAGAAHSGNDAAALDGGSGGKGGKGGGSGKGGTGATGGKGSPGGKGGTGPIDGEPVAGSHSVTPVDGGYCCIPSEKPNCCMAYGGFVTDPQQCYEACDGMPSPSEAWTLHTDDHGCKSWVEPREWTDCCGCPPHSRICDASGTWKVEYTDRPSCVPSGDTFTLSVDDDGGAAEVSFQNRGLEGWQCSGGDQSTYEATAVTSENGCVVTLSSHSKYCTSSELQCDVLDLKLYINLYKAVADVEGASRTCWCGGSPSGSTAQIKGTATRM
jgi:hypothetical protein